MANPIEYKNTFIPKIDPLVMVSQVLIEIPQNEGFVYFNIYFYSNKFLWPLRKSCLIIPNDSTICRRALSATCGRFDVRGIPPTLTHKGQEAKLKLCRMHLETQHI